MKRWLALVACALAAAEAPGPGAPPDDSPLVCPLAAFVEKPAWQGWVALEAAAQTGRCPGTPAPEVVEYSHAVANRDLIGSPGGYAKEQLARADAALAELRRAQTEDLWRLLRAMAAQTFDDELVLAAAELTARLAPQRFEALASDTVKANPARAPIFERVRQRWLAGK